jgi:hypothetical protein
MAMTFTQAGPRKPGFHTIEVFGTLVASGNYAANGDVVDFTQLGSILRAKDPLFVDIQGKAGFIYQYDITNKKVLVYSNTAGGANAPLGEHTAAAYAAGVTGDTIRVRMVFSK